MARIFSRMGDAEKPSIARADVARFFDERVRKIQQLGAIRAVIYQDKDPALAEQRDAAEKTKVMPLLQLDGTQRVLDIGCGTGRWAKELVPRCCYYHGIDFSDGFVAYARARFQVATCRFSVASADAFSLSSLDEREVFDRVLCAGVLMYLNDDQVACALRNIFEALKVGGFAFFREPQGIYERLTIKQHHSVDMDQDYNAIYRTHNELAAMVAATTQDDRFRLLTQGDVYDDDSLNNRSETRQRWFIARRES